MCIICIKPKNKELPSKEIIQTMCENNPHGNGFCYAENDSVIIKKGFMGFESFYEALNKIPNIKGKNVVLHMRITTHGSTSQANCHPFPLSNSIGDLKATDIRTSVGVIHNGIIRSVEADKENDLSDTMTYIKDVLHAKYVKDNAFMDKDIQREIIQEEINSKMVIMKSDGDYYTIGEFNTDSNGYIYSNYSYIPYDYTTLYSKGEEVDEEDFPFSIMLRDDDFIKIDSEKIYGYEEFLFLTQEGVYIETFEGITKVANYAFDKKGSIISLSKRIMEEEEEVVVL